MLAQEVEPTDVDLMEGLFESLNIEHAEKVSTSIGRFDETIQVDTYQVAWSEELKEAFSSQVHKLTRPNGPLIVIEPVACGPTNPVPPVHAPVSGVNLSGRKDPNPLKFINADKALVVNPTTKEMNSWVEKGDYWIPNLTLSRKKIGSICFHGTNSVAGMKGSVNLPTHVEIELGKVTVSEEFQRTFKVMMWTVTLLKMTLAEICKLDEKPIEPRPTDDELKAMLGRIKAHRGAAKLDYNEQRETLVYVINKL